ncbi:hypothetical protein CIB84_010997, partial [Bambusicola thoracicus]
ARRTTQRLHSSPAPGARVILEVSLVPAGAKPRPPPSPAPSADAPTRIFPSASPHSYGAANTRRLWRCFLLIPAHSPAANPNSDVRHPAGSVSSFAL